MQKNTRLSPSLLVYLSEDKHYEQQQRSVRNLLLWSILTIDVNFVHNLLTKHLCTGTSLFVSIRDVLVTSSCMYVPLRPLLLRCEESLMVPLIALFE